MTSRKLPLVISEDQFLKLLSLTFNPSHRVQIALMWYAGLRVSEMLALTVQDLDFKEGFLKVVAGKGKKDRLVYMPKPLQQELKNYLVLFPRQDRITLTHRRSVQTAVKRAGERVGITGLHPHTFRHGSATKMYEVTGDIAAVKDFLGHSNIATTDIYTHLGKETKRKIGEKVWR